MSEDLVELISQRVQTAQWLLEFYCRAVTDRKYRQATRILQLRIKLLRGLRDKRGYES